MIIHKQTSKSKEYRNWWKKEGILLDGTTFDTFYEVWKAARQIKLLCVKCDYPIHGTDFFCCYCGVKLPKKK